MLVWSYVGASAHAIEHCEDRIFIYLSVALAGQSSSGAGYCLSSVLFISIIANCISHIPNDTQSAA
jgi:hypothetical protein